VPLLQAQLRLPRPRPTSTPPAPGCLLRAAGIWVIPADVVDPVSHFEALKLQTMLPPLMEREVGRCPAAGSCAAPGAPGGALRCACQAGQLNSAAESCAAA
jgi:hypothetical protein